LRHGATPIMLYTTSTLYHCATSIKERVLRTLDHPAFC
jgi:hypothetical protein